MSLDHKFLLLIFLYIVYNQSLFGGMEPPKRDVPPTDNKSKVSIDNPITDPLSMPITVIATKKETNLPVKTESKSNFAKRKTISLSADDITINVGNNKKIGVVESASLFLESSDDTFDHTMPLTPGNIMYAHKEDLFKSIEKLQLSQDSAANNIESESLMKFLHNELVNRRLAMDYVKSDYSSCAPFYLVQDKPYEDYAKINGLQCRYGRLYQYLLAVGVGLKESDFTLMKSIESEELSTMNEEANKLSKLSQQEKYDQLLTIWGTKIESNIQEKFIVAVENGNIDLVKSLINIDNCLRSQNNIGYCHYGFKAPLFSSDFQDRNGMTGLHLAVKQNHFNLVKFFIEDNRDFIVKTPDEKNAVQCNCLNANRLSLNGYTPLDLAFLYQKDCKQEIEVQKGAYGSSDTLSLDSYDEQSSNELLENRKIINILINKAKIPLKSNRSDIQMLITQDQTHFAPSRLKERQTLFQKASTKISSLFQISPISTPRNAGTKKIVPV